MLLLEISQADLTTLDTSVWCEVPARLAPCDHCRHTLAVTFIRMGSMTDQFSWIQIPPVARRFLRLPNRLEIRLYAMHIATLATDQHLRLAAACPVCGDPLELDIFLNTSKP